MTARVKEKKIGFFRAELLAEGRVHTIAPDWKAWLKPLTEASRADLTHDSTVYDIQLGEEDQLPVLGVHQVLNMAFMTHIGDRTITDLMDEAAASNAKAFAHSTGIAFLPVGGVVAIATGTNASPKPPKVLTDFLERHLPQGAGAHWRVVPVMDQNKIQRLRDEAQGVAEFSTRIRAVRALWEPEDSNGVARYADELANRLGTDIVIDLRVTIPPESRNRGAFQRLKDAVVGDLGRVVADPASKAAAKAVFPGAHGDMMEDLNLVARHLTESFEVHPDVAESQRFTSLVEQLRDVGGAMEDRVRRLVEG